MRLHHVDVKEEEWVAPMSEIFFQNIVKLTLPLQNLTLTLPSHRYLCIGRTLHLQIVQKLWKKLQQGLALENTVFKQLRQDVEETGIIQFVSQNQVSRVCVAVVRTRFLSQPAWWQSAKWGGFI